MDRIALRSLARHLATQCPVLPPPPIPEPREPAACDLRMPFGKYRGEHLGDIAEENIGYIRWLTENIEDEDVAGAAAAVLDWFTGGGE